MSYRPAGAIIMENAAIVRERSLPPHVYGEVRVAVGDQVTASQILASGESPQDFIAIDVAAEMNLNAKQRSKLDELWAVEVEQTIEAGTPLVKPRNRREQRRVPKAPATSTVILIENGRVFLRSNPRSVQVYARIPGEVVTVLERGVRIRSTGVLIQCAWGNGRYHFGSYELEPEDGLASLVAQQNLFSKIGGRTYVLERTIEPNDLRLIVELQLGGLIAPSMPFYLREAAELVEAPIILTEGFGDRRPTRRSYDMLRKHKETAIAIDAKQTSRWELGRPEMLIPGSISSAIEPDVESPLAVGATVRVRSEPYLGEVVEVVRLPETPVRLPNGLRTMVAEVRVRSREVVPVPLANLEVMGESRRR